MLKIAAATDNRSDCKDGPDEQYTPFCDNCNGHANDKSEDLAGDARGVCVGFLGGEYFESSLYFGRLFNEIFSCAQRRDKLLFPRCETMAVRGANLSHQFINYLYMHRAI